MEISELNLIGDFEAGMKCLQNPSLLSKVSLIDKVPRFYSFWTWGALILAVFATFTSVFNRIKLFIHQIRLRLLASCQKSCPQQIFGDDDFDFDFSDDDCDDDTPSSVAESDDEDLDSEDHRGEPSPSRFLFDRRKPKVFEGCDGYSVVVLSDEGNPKLQTEVPIDLPNPPKVRIPLKSQLSLDARLSNPSYINMMVENAVAYSTCTVDVDLEKGKPETQNNEEKLSNLKNDDEVLMKSLQKQISFDMGGKYMQLLMNQSLVLYSR